MGSGALPAGADLEGRSAYRGGAPLPGGGASRAPSLLAITSELPWPLDTGGHLRTFHLLRALARRFRVRLVVPVTEGQRAAVEALGGHGIAVVPVRVGPRVVWREAVRGLAAAARGEPYVLFRRHDRPAVWAALRREAGRERPDALYLDHLDSFLYRSALPGTPAVLDLHNVYSTLTRRAAAERPSRASRWYLRREAALLDRVERRAVAGVDALMAVSDEDRSHFAGLGARAAYVVPNGVDCAAYETLPTGRRSAWPLILYVGSLSWGPNAAAARTLAVEVLPRIRERIPGATARIVGREPSPEVRALGQLPGVEVLGSVPDVRPHLAEAAVLAVPLEAGGGTRLKILEAFAAGLPVVSTPVGCEGIDADDGEHLRVVARAQMAEGIVALLDDRARGERLAARARDLARARYDWGAVGTGACDVVEAALAACGVRLGGA